MFSVSALSVKFRANIDVTVSAIEVVAFLFKNYLYWSSHIHVDLIFSVICKLRSGIDKEDSDPPGQMIKSATEITKNYTDDYN